MTKDVFIDKAGIPYTKEKLIEGIVSTIQFSETYDNGGSAGWAGGLFIGTFVKPDGFFHVNRAIQYGLRHAYPKYIKGKCGHCAASVRLMLMSKEGGNLDLKGWPGSAYQYAEFLPKIGFRHIATLNTAKDQAKWTSLSAMPGDIAVMPHAVHGHICMFTGNIWVSDFKQHNMWVYGGDGTCAIFRWGGKFAYD